MKGCFVEKCEYLLYSNACSNKLLVGRYLCAISHRYISDGSSHIYCTVYGLSDANLCCLGNSQGTVLVHLGRALGRGSKAFHTTNFMLVPYCFQAFLAVVVVSCLSLLFSSLTSIVVGLVRILIDGCAFWIIGCNVGFVATRPSIQRCQKKILQFGPLL